MRKPLRFKRKKKRVSFLRSRLFWYITGILFFLTFLFYTVVLSPWLQIKEVHVTGVQEIPQERLLAVLDAKLWWNWFGIPTNSILLFDIKGTEEKLSFAFPAILHVAIERSLSRALMIKVQEREQIGTWCLPVEADNGSTCFAIDINGVPFKEVQEQGKYVVFDFKGEPTLGQELLTPSLVSTLLDFKERFQEAGELSRFLTMTFKIGMQNEVQGVTEKGWRILLDLKEDMDWQQTKLQLVLEQKIPLENREKLEYIDLRFGDQAYIKYQD